MDAYFARIGDILREPLPSRIRFMLEDVIELRKHHVRGLFVLYILNPFSFLLILMAIVGPPDD